MNTNMVKLLKQKWKNLDRYAKYKKQRNKKLI